MAKPSEDTLTTVFRDFLIDGGIKAEAFPVWRTPKGIRKPDLLIHNSKFYPVEAKLKEKDLIKDIVKIQNDYLKFSKELELGGGFIIKHPNPSRLKLDVSTEKLKKKFKRLKFRLILMFPQDDSRQFEILYDTISNLVPIIKETIYYERIKEELDLQTAIDILRDTTKYLESTLQNIELNILIEKLGGLKLFKDILDINVKKENNSIRVAISFFILTQLLFYYVVAKNRPDTLEPLDEIENIDQLNKKYFKKVLDVNYEVIFGIDIVSHLPEKAVEHINTIILTLKSLRPENIRGDLLGTIFHDLIPFDLRKRVAAYYTNILATQILAELTIENSDDSVLDLACGSGGLLVAAYHRKKRIIQENSVFTEDDHKKFISEQLYGIDIMPFSVNIASCNLALQSPHYVTNQVNIALWDSTDLEPGDVIPEFTNLKYLFRTKTLDAWLVEEKIRRISELSTDSEKKKEIKLKKSDVILMNPPFTRQERLPKDYKDKLKKRFNQFGEIYDEKMGLHGVFILIANSFIKKGGKIGLVLPASILARESFSEMRKYLSRQFKIKMIVYNTSRLNFSESTLWREILLILKKEKPTNSFVKICRLTDYPENVPEAISLSKSIKKKEKSPKFQIIEINQQDLCKMNKWYDWSSITIVSDLFHHIYNLIQEKDFTISIGERFDCIRCDLEHLRTKSNLNCFIQNKYIKESNQLKEDWIGEVKGDNIQVSHIAINEARFKIPLNKIGRGLRTTSNLQKINVESISDFVLLDSFKNYKDDFLRYQLDRKKIKDFDEKEFSIISDNYNKRKSHLILNRRLYLASPGTSYVAFYSEEPIVGIDTWGFYNMDKKIAKILTLWLNSTLAIIQLLIVGVAIEGNWMKVHKYMLDRIFIPDPDNFNNYQMEELNNLFGEVSEKEMPSLVNQLTNKNDIRRKIDQYFINLLDINIPSDYKNGKEISEILQHELLKELKGLCPTDF